MARRDPLQIKLMTFPHWGQHVMHCHLRLATPLWTLKCWISAVSASTFYIEWNKTSFIFGFLLQWIYSLFLSVWATHLTNIIRLWRAHSFIHSFINSVGVDEETLALYQKSLCKVLVTDTADSIQTALHTQPDFLPPKAVSLLHWQRVIPLVSVWSSGMLQISFVSMLCKT